MCYSTRNGFTLIELQEASAQDILAMTEAARLVGIPVFSIPDDFALCGGTSFRYD